MGTWSPGREDGAHDPEQGQPCADGATPRTGAQGDAKGRPILDLTRTNYTQTLFTKSYRMDSCLNQGTETCIKSRVLSDTQRSSVRCSFSAEGSCFVGLHVVCTPTTTNYCYQIVISPEFSFPSVQLCGSSLCRKREAPALNSSQVSTPSLLSSSRLNSALASAMLVGPPKTLAQNSLCSTRP